MDFKIYLFLSNDASRTVVCHIAHVLIIYKKLNLMQCTRKCFIYLPLYISVKILLADSADVVNINSFITSTGINLRLCFSAISTSFLMLS